MKPVSKVENDLITQHSTKTILITKKPYTAFPLGINAARAVARPLATNHHHSADIPDLQRP